MEPATVRSRAGRPRATRGSTGRDPREEILDAAAALFVENGYAATTTRAIAERTGIRQASLYYHFAGKEEILAALLEQTVRPSVDVARSLRADDRLSPAAALHRLAVYDVEALAAAPHNVGTLYLSPEARHERFAGFRAARRELRDAYGALAEEALADALRGTWRADELGAVIIHLVEIAITLRNDGDPVDAEHVADACLRVCGLHEDAIAAARAAG
ncbi:TetR/AcrR family transcriptional regulator [Microbacterium rhizosphaerae]|uniref:Helix-turn-helix domain-containing protein n=1 Tax=Microbacterium rhizosphaerae TaxID=1678237 RepID=A0ABZ0SM30_9MICO|nr:helix-turn-helix domain-containing protein [Microbacterium rhizosphaerae]WPR88878.1 helix-turn-helix domain-containing protein [Microbacterium rhizosphaerae]